jgi:hypothetical protein
VTTSHSSGTVCPRSDLRVIASRHSVIRVLYQSPKDLTLAGGFPTVADWDSILAAPIRGEEDQMGQALTITRTEHTAEALREFAATSRDGAQVRRLLAIALILEGRSRIEAAELSGMDRQTLRDWVHRYNAAGIAA